jgi:flavin reductase (DIM6/NTAB) family NADH-FMN oxidoreductase RutF
MPNSESNPIALALGRIPTGVYVVSARLGVERIGFVGSFVMQTGFSPPVVSVAINQARAHLDPIRRAGRFALSILDERSQGAMKPFFRKPPPGGSPFDELSAADAPGGSPILTDCLAWLECALLGEHDSGDHVVVFGRVESADLCRPGDPSIRLRRNGLDY